MPASSIGFAHGVASGDPYANAVILWTRISPPEGTSGRVDVSWQISRSAGFEAGAIVDSGTFETGADRDWTVKVEADGLNADTSYYYRFRAGDAVSVVGQTKTLPVGSDPVRLAVFSCANFPAAETFDAYGRAAAINAANPYDAWLHLGDYIYEYGPGGYGEAEGAAGSRPFQPNREIVSLDDYRQRYAQYHTDANLQSLRAAAPLIAIWDDHETANDSWAGGAQNHQSASEGDWLARRDAALKAYYEWIPIREPGQRQATDGASALSPLTQGYRSFSFGDVLALHVLETRLTARDEQLSYPNAAAVQARIGAILADPALVVSYATTAGIAPPTSPAAVPAFAAALAPLVTQELVIATVQKAWGDPNRDLIGDTQMAWLQQQMATSSAAWQVLSQQVLMQSMALPAELLLNAGNLSLLDKYAAPLQKLATGTPFASLAPAEQALFAEAGKIPYNLDAWDGYGVERETILQTALALGKRLISLGGDTHNAWAGLLDTMSAGSKPAGTVAGVEFATPGVTSPGLEKYLPGADAYIRAKYPAVDGLDALFRGYVNGLKYADLNRRGFLDLTVSKEQAVGSFQFLNGTDAISGQPLWSSESVVSSASYELSTSAEARPLITWQPGWRELDLVFGMAVDGAGGSTLLDPDVYASVPREGIQLADVTVQGSAAADRIYAGVGSTVDVGPGNDELFNTDSLGGNRLVGGIGTDRFFLRPVNDVVIGGRLLDDPASLGLPAVIALGDREQDDFLIDSSDPTGLQPLQILDFEPGIDQLLVDGLAPQGDWSSIRRQLQDLNVAINAAPQLNTSTIAIPLKSGTVISRDLAPYATDLDADNLKLVKLSGPHWISTSGTVLKAIVPAGLTEAQLAATNLQLDFSDGKAITSFTPLLTLNARQDGFVTGSGAGGQSQVKLYDASGVVKKQFSAFAGFNGSISVAYGDLNNDGEMDIVAAAGPGGGPHVKVFDGLSGNEIASFFAYDASFRGGVNVAVGDLNGDGRLELITGAGAGGGPHVKAFALNFSGGRATPQEFASFYAYDSSFRGGVSVAAGDVNGDGAFDIITGAGAGGGPHVKAFGFGAPAPARVALQELASFYAYDANFRGGVSVASGNIDGLGTDEIITGAGAGGGPHVKAFSRSTEGTLSTVSSFFAYDPLFRGGVEVGSMMSPSNLAVSRVLTGAGPGGGPHVRGFDLSNPLGQPSEVLSFYAESPAFRGGVAVS
jgi:phosphodiesterase/alkaline phosphatase D-like protein